VAAQRLLKGLPEITPAGLPIRENDQRIVQREEGKTSPHGVETTAQEPVQCFHHTIKIKQNQSHKFCIAPIIKRQPVLTPMMDGPLRAGK
jgi:hypothetical protein